MFDGVTRQRRPHNASGFVLVTSLIFLVVLSVIVLAAMRKSLFDEKISGNEQDLYVAREAAEMGLRDAERDIAGLRFDGTYCATAGATACGGNLRIAGTRPANATDTGNFWTLANAQSLNWLNTTVNSTGRPASMNNTNTGMYSINAVNACGRPLWQAADWDSATPSEVCTDGSSYVITVPYGAFTGAANTFPAGTPLPRYLIEGYEGADLGIQNTNKLFFRITAVGFGRTQKADGTFTSVTLQSFFSAI